MAERILPLSSVTPLTTSVALTIPGDSAVPPLMIGVGEFQSCATAERHAGDDASRGDGLQAARQHDRSADRSPEFTYWAPPLLTMALLTKPPERTLSSPPDEMTVPIATPATTSVVENPTSAAALRTAP